MIPTTLARSMTEKATARPRSFSAIAKKMCPPSSGRNGARLITPSESDTTPRRNIACAKESSKDWRVLSYAPTTLETCLRFCDEVKIPANVDAVLLMTVPIVENEWPAAAPTPK